MRTRLAALAITVGMLMPIAATVATRPAPAAATDTAYWACVGEVDVNVGVCLNNPIPPWAFFVGGGL